MPAMPAEIALANRFHGLNRSVAPQELNETESPDCTDCASYLDRIGALGPRLGRSVEEVKTYSLLGLGSIITPWGRYRIYCDSNGDWTASAIVWPGTSGAALASPTVSSRDTAARVRTLQYRYRTYCFNGRDAMRSVDGVSWQLAGISGGVFGAQFTPSISLGGTGLTGTYYYYVVAANSKRLDPTGRPLEAIPSVVSLVASPVNQTVTIANIPATHLDPQVDTWNIYRTLNGGYDSGLVPDQQDFFLLTTIAIGATSYADSTADSTGWWSGANRLRFNQNTPPAFKHGAIYGDRMFGAGFDPIITGTATVNADTTKIDFSGITIPDGAKGCWFQASGSATKYRIKTVGSTTQITLDRAFVGALSASAYTIFRYPWEIYFSEFLDVDAWGSDGDGLRNMQVLPRGQEVTGLAPYNGRLYVFTKDSIFEIYGKGPNRIDVKINPEPSYFGLGAVSGDAIVRVDNELHFLSLRGPAIITGNGEPKLYGIPLLTDWLDSLTTTEHALCCAGSDNTRVWYSVPSAAAQTLNSKTFRYERLTESWWEEVGICPTMYIRQDRSNGAVDQLVYIQNRFVCRPRVGQFDLIENSVKRTLTAATSLTATIAATNLLAGTEQFNGSVWQQSVAATITANTNTAPDGTLTADSIVVSAAAAASYMTLYQDVTVPNDSAVYTLSIYVKQTVGATIFPGFGMAFLNGSAKITQVCLDTNNGTVTTRPTFTAPISSSAALVTASNGDTYYRFQMTFANDTSANTVLRIQIIPSLFNSGYTIQNTYGNTIVAWGAQLEIASSASTYTRQFPTLFGGCEQVMARFYRPSSYGAPTFLGLRRIISNTATVLTWSSDATLPYSGVLSLQAADIVEIGNVTWYWRTRSIDFGDPMRKVRTHLHHTEEMYVTFNAIDAVATLLRNDFIDGIEKSDLHLMALTLYTAKYDVGKASFEYACRLQSRNGAVIKHVALKGQMDSENV